MSQQHARTPRTVHRKKFTHPMPDPFVCEVSGVCSFYLLIAQGKVLFVALRANIFLET